MRNCRKGDIAVIVRALVPQNLGALVEVVAPSRQHPNHWVVRPLGGPRLASDGSFLDQANVPDTSLRPIRRPRPSSVPRGRRFQPTADLFSQ